MSRLAALSLYRAQLRTARLFDASPHLLPLTALRGSRSELLTRPPAGGDAKQAWASRVARAAEKFRRAFLELGAAGAGADADGARARAEAASAGIEPPPYSPPRSLAAFVQLAWRQSARGVVAPASSAGLAAEAAEEAAEDELDGADADAGADLDADALALDAAFALQRQLKQAADLADALAGRGAGGAGGAGPDAELADLSSLAPSAVTEAAALAPGVLLAQHPSAAPADPNAGHCALVFVFDISRNLRELHGDEAWTVRGYVVNRPFPRPVGEMLRPQSPDALGAFGRLPLFHGGMDAASAGRVSILHRFADLEGAAPVNEDAGCPLFVGGSVAAINARLDSGAAAPGDFKVVLGAWSSRLDETGTGAGAGAGASAGPEGAAEPSLSWPEEALWLQGDGAGAAELAMLPAQILRDAEGRARDGGVEGYNFARFWHQNAAWAHFMRAAGRSIREAAEQRRAAAGASVGAGDAEAEAEAAEADEAAARRGREVESWAKLHAAVVGYARALGREMVPVSYPAWLAEQSQAAQGVDHSSAVGAVSE